MPKDDGIGASTLRREDVRFFDWQGVSIRMTLKCTVKR